MEDFSVGRVIITKKDEVFLQVYVTGEDAFYVYDKIAKEFTFEVPNSRFHPKVKAGLWDGKKSLFNKRDRTIYVGLLKHLVDFLDGCGYKTEIDGTVDLPEETTREDADTFTRSLDIMAGGVAIPPHEHQVDAIHHALDNARCILRSPTASGKSYIIYALTRRYLARGSRVLVVVPRTSLVEQFYSDFIDYSSANGFSVEDHCQRLYSGFEKKFTKDVLFTTWQSIVDNPPEWFTQFDVIFGDEAHEFKADSLIKIMEGTTKIPVKIGTTGSLDGKKINELTLIGLFGPVFSVATTKELQDKGIIVQSQITQVSFCYPEAECKHIATCNTKLVWDDKKHKFAEKKVPATYAEELEFLLNHPVRNRLLTEMAVNTKGNSLVMFNHIEHGRLLESLIREKAPNRPLFFIDGSVPVSTRESVRMALKTLSGGIVVASYGTTSTGINIPSIEDIIFAHPTKSTIRVLQTLGRGLRLSQGKSVCRLWDVVDDMHWKKRDNFTLTHGRERYAIYASEDLPVRVVELRV